MKNLILVVLLACFNFAGCGKHAALNEPAGKPVELTADDRSQVNFSFEELKTWNAWEAKGNKLHNGGSYEEALYCYHQAMASWPKKLSDSAPEERKQKHRPEPTDTFFQKGFLYLKLKKPELAIAYLKRFESYFPGNKYAVHGIQAAEDMQKLH